MKIFLTLLILIILGGLGWYIFHNSEVSLTDEMMGEEKMEESKDTMMEESVGQEAMEEDNTDAGMEFPTVDADVSINAEAEVFNITGHNFTFSQTEIRVKEGDTVTINFSSTDGFHDWVVDEFAVATARVNTGDSTSVTFVADKAGTYEYYCSVGSHRANGMVGTLIVE